MAVACSAWAQRGRIVGRVEDPAGAVVGGAKVTLRGAMGDRTTQSGRTGEFVFEDLPDGKYPLLFILLDGFLPRVLRSIEVGNPAGVDLGSIKLHVRSLQDMDFPRRESVLAGDAKTGNLVGRIEGVVDGKQLSQASVALGCESGNGCWRASVNADGKFRLDGIPDGWYSLRVEAPGHYPIASMVEVVGGVETDYESIALDACVGRLR